ncbi:MAG: aspartate aminotransferase family protein [Chloroflexi bacterium]|nr:aspartate aminotransferase family protein [Chloroflexota bacterium]
MKNTLAPDWKKIAEKYFMPTFKRCPVTLVRGKGVRAWDDAGKEYLDFVGGWAVTSLGHCHPVVVEALTRQARELIQASNQFYTVPQAQLAQLLVENSCCDRVFICNSGAEADEGAVKLARRYGSLHLNGAYEVITAFNSFHGRTLAMVAATGQQKFQQPYVPLPDGFMNVRFSDIEAIMAATTSKTCAVMLEPIQGEGGVNIPDDTYLKQVREWCDEKGILLILDEVQTGLGRLGTLWGYQQYGVEPDVMTLAKGLGSGAPVGAILCKEKASVFRPGDHGSTFGGNPLVCAAAYATVKYILDNDIPGHVQKAGSYLMAGLSRLERQFKSISGIRGKGLLVALEFNRDFADDIVLDCIGRGLLLNKVKPNAIRFIPPLIVTEQEIDVALRITGESLKHLGG